jgi:hypothetical protein
MGAGVPSILDQIKLKALVVFLAGDEKNTADRLYRAAFAADDAAHIAAGDANLNANVFAITALGDFNGIRFADERFDDLFYSFFHVSQLNNYSAAASASGAGSSAAGVASAVASVASG